VQSYGFSWKSRNPTTFIWIKDAFFNASTFISLHREPLLAVFSFPFSATRTPISHHSYFYSLPFIFPFFSLQEVFHGHQHIVFLCTDFSIYCHPNNIAIAASKNSTFKQTYIFSQTNLLNLQNKSCLSYTRNISTSHRNLYAQLVRIYAQVRFIYAQLRFIYAQLKFIEPCGWRRSREWKARNFGVGSGEEMYSNVQEWVLERAKMGTRMRKNGDWNVKKWGGECVEVGTLFEGGPSVHEGHFLDD